MRREEFVLDDVRLDITPERRVPVYVAGRGPQILTLAGDVGDGAIAGAGLSSIDEMTYATERVAEGCRIGDRSMDDVDIVCWTFLSVADEESVAMDAVAETVARIVHAVPTPALEAIGVPRAEAERVKRIDDVGEASSEELRNVVSGPVLDQFAVAGTPATCRRRVLDLVESGVDHVGVLPFENESNDVAETLALFGDDVARPVVDESVP